MCLRLRFITNAGWPMQLQTITTHKSSISLKRMSEARINELPGEYSDADVKTPISPQQSPTKRSRPGKSAVSSRNTEIGEVAESQLALAGDGLGSSIMAQREAGRKLHHGKTRASSRQGMTVQDWEKTVYDEIFEDIHGEDATKPPDTDWTTIQHRRDSNGQLWVWTGRMNGNRKVYVPSGRGSVEG